MCRITILADNLPGSAPGGCRLDSEWGLAIYIEYNGRRILLDTGASGLFAENAGKLGINLEYIDFGVLSHAHYDHAGGVDRFFEVNQTASFYVSGAVDENCYSLLNHELKYDGIKKGILKQFSKRLIKVNSLKYCICDGVYLLGHSAPGLDMIGKRVGQYVLKNDELIPDNFAHEQSLIFQTEKGLVVLNSCSHSGVDVIIKEAMTAFPGQNVYAMIGGFHMFMDSEEAVREHAKNIKAIGTQHIVTGHCTGRKQYLWLKDELEKDGKINVEQMHCGKEILI